MSAAPFGERREHPNPLEAVGARGIGRADGHPVGREGEEERGGVRGHVAGIGHERQRARQPAGRGLHDGVACRENEDEAHPARVRAGDHGGVVGTPRAVVTRALVLPAYLVGVPCGSG